MRDPASSHSFMVRRVLPLLLCVHVNAGEESFTDLDYANDVARLAEMLKALVAGLLVLLEEAAPLLILINCIKIKSCNFPQ